MSRTYKATGINLKSMPIGEADRLLTILTREYGLVRAIAMGARKHNSSLGGRSGLFVVNQLLIAKGRSLDKVTQAETVESYPGLGQDLRRLTASQYLAELCLCQALSEQPQEELFLRLNEQLKRLERSPTDQILPTLLYAIFELLVLEGVAPEVHRCGTTQTSIVPDFENSNWRIGFSVPGGGTVTLEVLAQLQQRHPAQLHNPESANRSAQLVPDQPSATPEAARTKPVKYSATSGFNRNAHLHRQINAIELAILQVLSSHSLSNPTGLTLNHPDVTNLQATFADWLSVERLLRQYAQYHFDRTIRSAALVDACFLSSPTSEPFES